MEPIIIVSSLLLWAAVAFNLLLTLALIRRVNKIPLSGNAKLETLKPGEPAPDFSAYTLLNEKRTLSDFKGHELALVFVSPNCRPCLDKMPEVEALRVQAHQFGVTLLPVIFGTQEEAKAFVDEFQINLPILRIPLDSTFRQDYKVPGTPSYYFIDREGKIKSGGVLEDIQWKKLVSMWQGTDSDISQAQPVNAVP